MTMHSTSWKSKAADKRASTLSKIPPQWRLRPEDIERVARERDLTGLFIQQFLNAEEISIVSMDSLPLVDAIREGTLAAVQVTTAFCKTAAIAHQINNCLHEIFFDQSLERAAFLDDYYSKHNARIGPLHGLPVSLKNQLHVKGNHTTMGYIGWIGSNLGIKDPNEKHQVQRQIVSGEGALQALRGTALGLGTDIGGSVRIPAAFNSIFSLKLTPERIPYREVANTNPGQNTYRSTVGFRSTSLGGLELALKSVLSTQPWLRDPAVVPIPFRQEIVDEYLSRAKWDGTAKASGCALKLGIFWADGIVTPRPPITRGLHVVVDAVRNAGHKGVSWEPPNLTTAKGVHVSFLKADGAHDIHAQLDLSGEPLIPDLATAFGLKPPMGLLEYQDLTLQGLEYETQYSDYWNPTAEEDGECIVDAVIMPVAPHAAVIPGKYYHTACTEALNLLNYSAVVIPIAKADKNIDVFDDSYQPLNATDRLNWEGCRFHLWSALAVIQVASNADDPEIYDGAPIGVQLVERKFEEEKIWAIAKIVHASMRKEQ
ncbi:uncharacterized protein Z519_06707 [Cladophialophora bantiana CBS 173.52]|uniref:Amidase domain-containing protein n=1 Tax=Cladophialophora bantiana (strain ATCC 10958 / CBS 173.52 / CDC B-1940 / NIH 8579) TaxID=1442370 RepID=A0A0D2HHW4_CLAB1|nr:uncharacterized protein Z519_06707 [Cladophialophora bantiana CBS 173.52]KIW92858.1 hypothetical protein Z519_06707 [Cladophialophora bantiana CBS 173.52]